MGLISFTKTSRHKRFNYEPRYYDPVAEELKQRTEAIKQEIEAARAYSKGTGNFSSAARISRGFARAKSQRKKTSFLQIFLIVVLGTFCVAYLKYGNMALLILVFAVPVYFFARKFNVFESE
ncbi:hypothetical protein SAMN05421823_103276 [Catalinimonas alkaloidigena]|uniref:Uncharacterized protein n=1 Tax=Catalinimonas alkaloidigena TaxID=1075417 RepID=A0A1G9DWV7_9BACT|nr:hypothetical protein [Catalinimonas alkaloidigena]SDK68336.1 hypothetical protein SAMN05421823_103276 [Catalinimonas alkaloidigena]